MSDYRITRLAEADIEEVWLHIAQDRPSAADRMMNRFHERFELLGANPEIGEQRPDLADNLRQSIVGKYVLFYRSKEHHVEIVRVIHGARDVSTEFRRRFFGRH